MSTIDASYVTLCMSTQKPLPLDPATTIKHVCFQDCIATQHILARVEGRLTQCTIPIVIYQINSTCELWDL